MPGVPQAASHRQPEQETVPMQSEPTVLARAMLAAAGLAGYDHGQSCYLTLVYLGATLGKLSKEDNELRCALAQHTGKLGSKLKGLLPVDNFVVEGSGGNAAVRILPVAWQRYGSQLQQEQAASTPPGSIRPSCILVNSGVLSQQAFQQLCKQQRIAVDCEGVNLSRTGRLCLVQVAAAGPCYIFDLISGTEVDQIQIKAHLKLLLEAPAIQKVLHDGGQDAAALRYQLGIIPANIFDTQVAGMLLRELEVLKGDGQVATAAGKGRISLNHLLRQHKLPCNDQKQAIGVAMSKDDHFWEKRPLLKEALSYASQDVNSLLQLAEQQLAKLSAHAEDVALVLSGVSSQSTWAEQDRTLSLGSWQGRPSESPMMELVTDQTTKQAMLVPCTIGYEPEKPMRLSSNTDATQDAEVDKIMQILPDDLRAQLSIFLRRIEPDQDGQYAMLVELVADQGLPVMARFTDGKQCQAAAPADLEEAVRLLSKAQSSIAQQQAAQPFNAKNRAGMDGTLHRISAIRGDGNAVIGLTYRIGRHVHGVADIVADKMRQMWSQDGMAGQPAGALLEEVQTVTPSLLILGPPGRGKTTLLRGIAAFTAAADGLSKRVVVVDGSREIAGDGRVPHACIGQARRMPVPAHMTQAAVAMEALQNHNAEVVIIDELSSKEEVASSRKLSQQGVGLVATAHAVSLQSIMRNPELNPLIGGLSSVTLGDALAIKSNNDVKTRTERAGSPTFSAVIEMLAPSQLRIYDDTAKAVDALLRGEVPASQLRTRCQDGRILVQMQGHSQPASAWHGFQGGMNRLLSSLLAS